MKYVSLFHAPMPPGLFCFCLFVVSLWDAEGKSVNSELFHSSDLLFTSLCLWAHSNLFQKKVNSSELVANRLKECSCGNFQHPSITFLPSPLHPELDIAHRYQVFAYRCVYSIYTCKSILPHMHKCILYWLCFSNTFIICSDWISCPSKWCFKNKKAIILHRA